MQNENVMEPKEGFVARHNAVTRLAGRNCGKENQ